jgi:carboxyl-terminal processing protease
VQFGAGQQTPIAQALAPLREAYRLLLEHYVDPLPPGSLAAAAVQGMHAALAKQGIAVPDAPLPAPSGDPQANWQVLSARFRALASQFGGRVSARDLAYAAITSMADSTNDSHTIFMTPREYDEHRAWARGDVTYGGVGLRIRGPDATIAQVYATSPAVAAGLQVGDVIVAVDDRPVTSLKLDEVASRVRGPEGTSVRLRVRRAGGGEQEFTLVRAQVNIPFVETQTLGEFGYLALRGFPEPSVADSVERAIRGLQGQGVRGIVFDLRGNSGGRLDVGTRLLSRFVGDGPVYQIVDRQGRGEIHRLRGAQPILTVPLVVLVDEGTASMGELFAATVQERGAGRVLGTTTAGSVSASVVQALGDGSALQMSVERILTGGGRTLDRVGLTPDQVVPLAVSDLQAGNDPQLDAALGHLRTTLAAASAPAR